MEIVVIIILLALLFISIFHHYNVKKRLEKAREQLEYASRLTYAASKNQFIECAIHEIDYILTGGEIDKMDLYQS